MKSSSDQEIGATALALVCAAACGELKSSSDQEIGATPPRLVDLAGHQVVEIQLRSGDRSYLFCTMAYLTGYGLLKSSSDQEIGATARSEKGRWGLAMLKSSSDQEIGATIGEVLGDVVRHVS